MAMKICSLLVEIQVRCMQIRRDKSGLNKSLVKVVNLKTNTYSLDVLFLVATVGMPVCTGR